MGEQNQECDLLTYPEVAERLRMDRRSVQNLVARRAIPVIRLNARCARFRWADVEAALAKLTIKAL